MNKNTMTYKNSGINIKKADDIILQLKNKMKNTYSDLIMTQNGDYFSALKIPKGYNNPILVTTTDGVGTKLKIASDVNKYENIGIDLVAMSVNDIICSHAKPLAFLDYIALNNMNEHMVKTLIKSIINGCLESQCSLIGGETAQMGDLYKKGEFDLAGFCIGITEESNLHRYKDVKYGDLVIGLPSNGLHSNGYTLVRKLLKELNINYNDEFNSHNSFYEELLKPTKIYANEFNKISPYVKSVAHITGGGIAKNLYRLKVENFNLDIDITKFFNQDIYKFLNRYIDSDEMLNTFNCGFGLIIIVDKKDKNSIFQHIKNAVLIGEVKRGSGNINIH